MADGWDMEISFIPAPWTVGLNYPFRGHKTTMWEGGMRAIGFVYAPMLLPPFRVSEQIGLQSAPSIASAPSTYRELPSISSASTSRTFDGLFHVTDWLPTLVRGAAGVDVRSLGAHFFGIDGIDQWDAIAQVAIPGGAVRTRGLQPDARSGHHISSVAARTDGSRPHSLHTVVSTPRQQILHNIEGIGGRGAAVLRVAQYKLMLNMAPSRGFDGWCDMCRSSEGCTVPVNAGPGSEGPAIKLVQHGAQVCCWNPPMLDGSCPNATRPQPPPPVLLFDIDEDPRELHNIADSSPSIVSEMLRLMDVHNRSAVSCCICTGSTPDELEMSQPPLEDFWFRFRDEGPNSDPSCKLMNEPPWRASRMSRPLVF
eukprot:scaffold99557_cov33-Tisochrysis_lutea.AAC.1